MIKKEEETGRREEKEGEGRREEREGRIEMREEDSATAGKRKS